MLTITLAHNGSAHHVLLLAGAALLILAGLLALRLSSRPSSTTLFQRTGHTEDSFVHDAGGIGLNSRIARTTYRYLQRTRRISFPIFVGAELNSGLGLDDLAIAETVRHLMAENHRCPIGRYQHHDLVTVEDLISLVQRSPQAEFDMAA